MTKSFSEVDTKDFDKILNTMRFQGLAHLMNMDYADLTPDEVNKECRKLAVEMKILSGRLMAIAFDNPGATNGRKEEC